MRTRIVAALAGAALVLSGCSFSLYGKNLPGGTDTGDHPFRVTAYFDNVLDLVPQSNVKVNDVAVGKVISIALSKSGDPSGANAQQTNGWTAKVTMEVRNDVMLGKTAQAQVQQTSLLGEKFVQLIAAPGDPCTDRNNPCPPAQRLHDGSVIPLANTSSAPEVEEVLGALSLVLNGGGIQQIHTIAQELNNALHGHESDVKDLFTQLQTFTGTLDAQKDHIVNSMVSLDNLSKTLNQQSDLLVTTLNTMPQALQILADERNQLMQMLQSLSNLGVVATDVVTKTQTQLVHALRVLDPALVSLAQAGDKLPKALKIMGTFPFPVGLSRQFVRGDYANLHLYLNLNLKDQLCALGVIPKCAGGTKSVQHRKLTAGADNPLPPMLIGGRR